MICKVGNGRRIGHFFIGELTLLMLRLQASPLLDLFDQRSPGRVADREALRCVQVRRRVDMCLGWLPQQSE